MDRAVEQPDAGHARIALDGVDANAASHRHAVRLVQPDNLRRQLLAEDTDKWRGRHLDDGDVDAEQPQTGRHLAPDEATTHDDGSVRVRGGGSQSPAVPGATQHMDAVDFDAG